MSMSNVIVSLSFAQNSLELFDTSVVNIERTPHVKVVTFMAILIPLVNIPIIHSIHRDKSRTFINNLVLLDCVNALGHVPILLEFYQ